MLRYSGIRPFFAGIQIEFHAEESKVYGYACFCKADVAQVDSIKVDEITLTFVCKGYPRKLAGHLTDDLPDRAAVQELARE